MPIYISRGKFTTDAVKGMLAKPENREEAVANLFKSFGGKLIGWYLTFGHHDWLVIGEFPDNKAAASAGAGRCWGRQPLRRRDDGCDDGCRSCRDLRRCRKSGAKLQERWPLIGALALPSGLTSRDLASRR